MIQETNPQNEKTTPKRTPSIPQTDIDLGAVAVKVGQSWLQNPNITLVWTNSAEFVQTTTVYNQLLAQKNDISANRPQLTLAIDTAEARMNEALSYVKDYIKEKYKKQNSANYYAAFGMRYRSGSYELPKDQNGRLEALKQMATSIAQHGFTDKEYGGAFWNNLHTEYEQLIGKASSKDGEFSNKTGSKNVLKQLLKKTLNSIILIIKGNYPETYKQELRNWGFQKEKY